MKFQKYFISVIFCFICCNGFCCGPYSYLPEEYYIFRAYKGDERPLTKSQRERNLKSWAGQYPSADISDIEDVVYKWNLSQLEELKHKKIRNSFIREIQKNGDEETIDYLVLAKKCERACAERASKWYYPFKNDPEIAALDSVIQKAGANCSKRLFDRYILQAVRAMFSLGRYEDIVSLWSLNEDNIIPGVTRDMIVGYVAGAAFRSGQKDEAIDYFLNIGDIESVKYCAAMNGVSTTELPSYLLSLFAEKSPDSPEIPRLLQEILYGSEDNWEDMSDYFKWAEMDFITRAKQHLPRGNAKASQKYYGICMKAVQKSHSPAVWYYSAAFLKDILGYPEQASSLLSMAEKTNHDNYLEESIKVFRIYLDSKISVYDSAYLDKLHEQLEWLDNKIISSINEETRTITSDEPYMMSCGFSYYYWNDMLRKILIGEVCPRMHDAGYPVLSLRLLNMADNRLVTFVNRRKVRWHTIENGEYHSFEKTVSMAQYRNDVKHPNGHDYSNYFFNAIDTIELASLIKYVNSVENPLTSFEMFLDERSYIDKDYLCEVVGTRYLREQKYEKAVLWLYKVSSSYQSKTNVKWYMTMDPFVLESPEGYSHKSYKLAFAKEMCSLQKQTLSKNPDIKGEALVKMGTGLRSSFTNCWALTQYHKYYYDDWITSEGTLAAIEKADQMISEGLHVIKDPEKAASAYLSQYLYMSVAEKYPETQVCKRMKASCDKLYDHKKIVPVSAE